MNDPELFSVYLTEIGYLYVAVDLTCGINTCDSDHTVVLIYRTSVTFIIRRFATCSTELVVGVLGDYGWPVSSSSIKDKDNLKLNFYLLMS